MKKRIGTKLYDTNTSEMIAGVGIGILYRKRTRKREWFLLIGDNIEPLDDKQARALLGEDVRVERNQDSDSVMIRVDRATHNVIAKRAEKEGLSINKYLCKIMDTIK